MIRATWTAHGFEKSSLDEFAEMLRKLAGIDWRGVWDDFRNWIVRAV
jgi:hypothetical protein